MLAFASFLLLSAAPDVSVETLRTVADRFDRAQIAQDRATLEAMTAPDLIFVGSNGVRQTRRQFIDGWMDPDSRYDPVEITDRYFLPLGPDAGVVGGETVLRGTASGQPFSVRIRFSDTFRRIGGQWRAVHIQVARIPEA